MTACNSHRSPSCVGTTIRRMQLACLPPDLLRRVCVGWGCDMQQVRPHPRVWGSRETRLFQADLPGPASACQCPLWGTYGSHAPLRCSPGL